MSRTEWENILPTALIKHIGAISPTITTNVSNTWIKAGVSDSSWQNLGEHK
jgi:hypothetical protein